MANGHLLPRVVNKWNRSLKAINFNKDFYRSNCGKFNFAQLTDLANIPPIPNKCREIGFRFVIKCKCTKQIVKMIINSMHIQLCWIHWINNVAHSHQMASCISWRCVFFSSLHYAYASPWLTIAISNQSNKSNVMK